MSVQDEFLDWLISLDDDDPDSPGRIDRRTVTLTQIIERARAVRVPTAGDEDTPQYEHDCDNCFFLGRFGNEDLYVCPSPIRSTGYGTYVARSSSEESDYRSGAVFVGLIPAITEAHRRATVRGMGLKP